VRCTHRARFALQSMKTVREVGTILGVALVAALAVNFISPSGIALVGQWDTAQGVVTAKAKNDLVVEGIEIGTVDLAKKMYYSGDYIFIDARSREDYEQGHIRGAISLPVGRFEDEVEAFLERYPPEALIVTYCSGRTCMDSHHLAEFLLEFGYDRVNVFIDGFPGWETAGHPIDESSE